MRVMILILLISEFTYAAQADFQGNLLQLHGNSCSQRTVTSLQQDDFLVIPIRTRGDKPFLQKESFNSCNFTWKMKIPKAQRLVISEAHLRQYLDMEEGTSVASQLEIFFEGHTGLKVENEQKARFSDLTSIRVLKANGNIQSPCTQDITLKGNTSFHSYGKQEVRFRIPSLKLKYHLESCRK